MSFFSNIQATFRNYKDFKGTSDRSAFWHFTLFRFVLVYIFSVPGIYLLLKQLGAHLREEIRPESLSHYAPLGIFFTSIGITVMLVCFIPYLTLRIRRLRDAGYSPYWLLLWLIPFLGPIIVLILCNKTSTQ